jgi:hypothetical protein
MPITRRARAIKCPRAPPRLFIAASIRPRVGAPARPCTYALWWLGGTGAQGRRGDGGGGGGGLAYTPPGSFLGTGVDRSGRLNSELPSLGESFINITWNNG